MNITEKLIDFARGDLTPSQRAHAIVDLSAVDWAGCGIAGAAEGSFADWAGGVSGDGPAGSFAGRNMPPEGAALVNGTLSHALDYDDTHFGHIGHPSVAVFPAVLAVKPSDWTMMHEAALVGVEASIRIGIWLGRDHYQRGFHQTATAGAFGACLGAARVLALSEGQMRNAVGLCATMASGLKAEFGTMGKPLNAGLAARAGVEAALWAQSGMTGAEDGLEAFAQAHGAARLGEAMAGLGKTWEIETLSHKFHACCHGLHATLEALRVANVSDMDRIEIETHSRWMSVCNQLEPDTGLAAKFSYRQVAAMAALGIPTDDIASFSDAVATDPEVVRMRAAVTVRAVDDLSETQARVRIETPDGPVTITHDLADPVPLDDLSGRIRLKISTLLGTEKATVLWSAMQRRDLASFKAAAFG